jgi:hypothetical protein
MNVTYQLHDQAALCPGRSPYYPLNTRQSELQSRRCCFRKTKHFFPISEIEQRIVRRQARSLVTIPTPQNGILRWKIHTVSDTIFCSKDEIISARNTTFVSPSAATAVHSDNGAWTILSSTNSLLLSQLTCRIVQPSFNSHTQSHISTQA